MRRAPDLKAAKQDHGETQAVPVESVSEHLPVGHSEESVLQNFWSKVYTNVSGSVRSNLIPMLVSLVFSLSLVVAYRFEVTRPFFAAVSRLDKQWGIGFAMLLTGLAAGLAPMVVLALLRSLPKPLAPHLIFNVLLWSVYGAYAKLVVLVNLWMNGEGTDAVTVIKKMIIDRFVMTPFITYPFLIVPAYRFRDCNFSCQCFIASLRDGESLLLQYCSMLVTTWLIWIPCSLVAYSFPSELQILIIAVQLLWFSLLIGVVSARSVKSTPPCGCQDDVARV